ncbi:VOC family protein [uncultured Hoeflea sp.]|uniref:VOC family protein n=1 Tax=uncultured Hoeflea sp. TaxID=538666 RepID=UPI002620EDAF|nr:VOC family protein [uncultured Hoeflea sp.]
MKSTNYYPVVITPEVAKTAAFYTEHLGFKPSFEADWYVHLQSVEDPSVNLAILEEGHPTIPESDAGAPRLILNFEVEDVDAVFARAQREGWAILKPLCDEAFGQRHFIARDPSGTMVDVITPIPPSAEFAAQYRDDALPQ